MAGIRLESTHAKPTDAPTDTAITPVRRGWLTRFEMARRTDPPEPRNTRPTRPSADGAQEPTAANSRIVVTSIPIGPSCACHVSMPPFRWDTYVAPSPANPPTVSSTARAVTG